MDKNINIENRVSGAAALMYTSDRNYSKSTLFRNRGKMAEKHFKDTIENESELYENEELIKSIDALGLLKDIPGDIYQAMTNIVEFVNKIDRNCKPDITKE